MDVNEPTQLEGNDYSDRGFSVDQKTPGLGMNTRIARLANSWEYYDLSPKERQQLILKLHMDPPEKVDAFLDTLTYPDPYKQEVAQRQADYEAKGNIANIGKNGAREAVASGVDMLGQTLAGVGAAKVPVVGPYLVGPAEGIASIATNRLNRALGLRDGDWNAKDTNVSEILGAALPPVVRAARGLKTYGMSHTANQINTADETNAANTEKYYNDITQTTQQAAKKDIKNQQAYDLSIDKRMQTRADQKQAALDTARAKAQQIRDDYLAQRKDLQDYKDTVAEHQDAVTKVPEAGTAGIDTPDYRADYAASNAAAAAAKPVATDSLRKTAAELGVSMEQPADPLQNPFRRITNALSTWGAPKAETEVASSLLGPNGKPITTTVPGDTGGIPVERATATLQKLGQIIDTAKGEELGAAKRLYAELSATLQAHRATDPASAKAIDKFLAGQAGWRKAQALQEYKDLFGPGSGYHYKQGGEQEVSSGSIRTNFDKLMQSKFFAGSFPGEEGQRELTQLQGALDLLPRTTVPDNPGQPTQPGPVQVEVPPNKALNPNRPGFPQVPEPPELKHINIPEQITPEAGQIKLGPVIMGKMAGSQVGGLAGEASGVGTYKGIVGGGYVGGGVVAAPWLISKLFLAGPKWEAAARAIINNGPMNPAKLAALTQLAKHPAVAKDLAKTALGQAMLNDEGTDK